VKWDDVDDVDSEDDRNINQEGYYWQMKLQVEILKTQNFLMKRMTVKAHLRRKRIP